MRLMCMVKGILGGLSGTDDNLAEEYSFKSLSEGPLPYELSSKIESMRRAKRQYAKKFEPARDKMFDLPASRHNDAKVII